VIRFIITVLVATLLHAVACILLPPFEFAATRPACFFFAFTGLSRCHRPHGPPGRGRHHGTLRQA
jgi:hypothetical protein